MRIAVLQTAVRQGEIDANLAAVREALAETGAADLVCLPGLFATGLQPGYASRQSIPGPLTDWLSALAAEAGTYLVGSLYEADADRTFETVVLFGSSGNLLARYRRCHRYPNETALALGGEFIVIPTSLGQIGLMAGPEVYYPEVPRVLRVLGAEVIVCPGTYADVRVLDRSPVCEYLSVAPLALSIQNEVTFVLASASGELERAADPTFERSRLAGHSAVAVGYYEGVKGQLGLEAGTLGVDVDLDLLLGSRTFTQRIQNRRPDVYRPLVGENGL